MTTFKLLLIFVVTTVHAHNITNNELRLPSFMRSRVCTKPGRVCKSCHEAAYCVRYPDGNLHVDTSQMCPPGTTCMSSTGMCSTASNLHCKSPANMSFQCRQPGVFPDIYNCNIYHVCVQDNDRQFVDIEGKCSKNFVFDPNTARCTRKLTGNCPQLVPGCKTKHQTGPLNGAPNFYYICMEKNAGNHPILVPEVYVCHYDYIYKDNKCVDPTPPPPPPPPPTGLNGKGRCNHKGTFYNPSDCTRYRVCKKKGKKPSNKKCPNGYKFVPGESRCVKMSC